MLTFFVVVGFHKFHLFLFANKTSKGLKKIKTCSKLARNTSANTVTS